MTEPIAFAGASERVEPNGARVRPSLQVLHNLPAGIRKQVRVADSMRLSRALALGPNLPALDWGATHEVLGFGADGFALSAARSAHSLEEPHPVVWIGQARDVRTLRPEGVAAFIPPASLILVEAGRRSEVLWAAEQTLAAPAQAVVIVQLDQGPNLAESRRLQVAAETGGSLGIVTLQRARSSTCQTRWECKPGPCGWEWKLTKNKSGQLGAWTRERL